jgi:hypothetical protein
LPKLQWHDAIGEWEWYDRKKDTLELNNVYNNPGYAEVAKKMHMELEELRVKYGDSKGLDQKYIDL